MKTIEWETNNKMRFESGFKTFDRQTNCIYTGNVIGARTQISFCVRAHNTLKNPAGESVGPGAMQEYDLDQFGRCNTPCRVPQHIRDAIYREGQDRGLILYCFRHLGYRDGRRIIVVDGWVLTDHEYNHVKTWYGLRGRQRFQEKSVAAVDEAAKYVCNNPPSIRDMTLREFVGLGLYDRVAGRVA